MRGEGPLRLGRSNECSRAHLMPSRQQPGNEPCKKQFPNSHLLVFCKQTLVWLLFTLLGPCHAQCYSLPQIHSLLSLVIASLGQSSGIQLPLPLHDGAGVPDLPGTVRLRVRVNCARWKPLSSTISHGEVGVGLGYGMLVRSLRIFHLGLANQPMKVCPDDTTHLPRVSLVGAVPWGGGVHPVRVWLRNAMLFPGVSWASMFLLWGKSLACVAE